MKLIKPNTELRNLITQNYSCLSCVSQLLFIRRGSNYMPVPIVFDVNQLPLGFMYFESDQILSETIQTKDELKTVFYKIGVHDSNLSASNLSTLVQFAKDSSTHIRIDCDYQPNYLEEQYSEIKLGKISLLHDDLCKVSYRLLFIEEIEQEKYVASEPFPTRPKQNHKHVSFKN